MNMKRKYLIAWVLWIVAFIIIETLALLNREPNGDTLSEFVWQVVAFPVMWWIGAAFMVWLTIHWLFDGKYDDPRKWFDDKDG